MMMTTTTRTTMTAEMTDPGRQAPGAAMADEVSPPSTGTWRAVPIAVAGLLVGVAVACLAALILTLNVQDVVDRGLRNDIELEDEADDLRAAVLDMRHYHRNVVFTGPTRTGVSEFEEAFAGLLEEIDELALVAIESPELVPAAAIREQAHTYYAAYRPAIDSYWTDRPAFDAASDEGLVALASLEAEAEELDGVGEELAAQALADMEQATSTATIILLAVLIGVLAVGLGLAAVAIRVLRELRGLYGAQKDAAAQLAMALRARNDFIADASHELRTPLTVLRGNAELGLAAGPGDSEPVLREIVAESERMTRLVEDLLLLARYDAGSLPLEVQEVDLEPWLADVSGRGEILARERGVRLAPSLRASGRARIDPGRVEQAVMILIDNATKFSPADETVRLEVEATRTSLVLEVIDRGPGISPDSLPFIFERFNRGDRTLGGRRSGAGLGLSIARAIAAAHGGTIEASSRVGTGTRMTITLPLSGPSIVMAGSAGQAQ
jgi:signal transduction histidine kinase